MQPIPATPWRPGSVNPMTELPEEGASVETAEDDDAAVDESASPDEYVDAASTAAVTTGHPAVDEVLRSLEGLDGRPVDEHVAAFEDAHEQLRRTLSGAGDDQD